MPEIVLKCVRVVVRRREAAALGPPGHCPGLGWGNVQISAGASWASNFHMAQQNRDRV